MKDLRRKRDTVVAQFSVGQLLLILVLNTTLWFIGQVIIGWYVKNYVW
jgi:hypothetical protein